MKLLFAIVQNDDQKSLTYALIEKNISVTRIASTGGFLRGGNSTLMIGVEADRLEETLADHPASTPAAGRSSPCPPPASRTTSTARRCR